MSKKKVAITLTIIALVAAAGVFLVLFLKKRSTNSGNGKLIYVESVRSITGVSIGNSSRYMGIVESQESKAVQKDSDKSVKEVYVKEGDYVKKGDKLFSYDTSEMEMNLEQLNIERTGISNSLSSLYNSLEDYNTQRNKATDEDDILSYTSQINSTSSSIKEEEYNLSAKDLEIQKMQESIDKAIVTSPMNGVIKKIGSYSTSSSSSDDDYDDYEDYDSGMDMNSESGDSNSGFITIIAEGDYRIRGIADETNIYSFTSGTPVILRSRVDESVVWKGSVSKVDMEPRQNNSDYSYDSGESASKYNFYVNPESTDDMILGQHLFIELDYGQSEKKEGLYLPSYMLVQAEENYFVWRQNSEGTIEKAQVTVGEYDEEGDTYEIKSGLSLDDYIAYPSDDVAEGNPTTTNAEDIQETEDEDSDESEDEIIDEEYDDASMSDSIEDFEDSIDSIEGIDDESSDDSLDLDSEEIEDFENDSDFEDLDDDSSFDAE